MRSADDQDDLTLWQRAAGGDGQAFGELFERHANRVYNHCFRRVGSWDAAADCTSIVFLETWRRRREIRLTTDSILPWLLAVANNVVRDQRRSQRRYQRALERIPGGAAIADHADNVAARVDDERTMQLILGLLGGLSRAEQDILSLCVWSEVSYADAAAVLGIPIGTVRSRLTRAKDRLRSMTSASSKVATALKAGERT